MYFPYKLLVVYLVIPEPQSDTDTVSYAHPCWLFSGSCLVLWEQDEDRMLLHS